MKQAVFSIVGPTSSGKTGLALKLAKKLLDERHFSGVAIISADSRQVYKGLETLTGADVPAGFEQHEAREFNYPFFKLDKVSMHGVSIIDPVQEWSVSHFQALAQEVINNSLAENVLPMVVGGTGLYHRHMLSIDPKLQVPPSEEVRLKAAQMPLQELQQWAEQLQPHKFAQLNNSDRNNPRRLIRIIEIGQALGGSQPAEMPPENPFKDVSHHFIGLQVGKEDLSRRITDRVIERMNMGAPQEVEAVFNRHQEAGKIPAFSTLGFKELLNYSEGGISKDDCILAWAKREISYSKRQMTWFNKNTDIKWFEYNLPQLELQVYQLLEKYLL